MGFGELILLIFGLPIVVLWRTLYGRPWRVDATDPRERRRQQCCRISFLTLLVPVSYLAFIIFLILWQTYFGGPYKVLQVYKTWLGIGAWLVVFSSSIGAVLAICGTRKGALSDNGFGLLASHLVALGYIWIASSTFGQPMPG